MQAIKNTIAENLGITANLGGKEHELAQPEHQFDIDNDVPSLKGKVACITGGSEGIGYAGGFVMLRAGLEKLFIIALNKEVFDGAVKDVSEKLGEEYGKKMVWLQCDLGDWKRVTEVAKQIRDQTDRLDILCLNGGRGIMTYQLTEYGVDRHMAVNHVRHDIYTCIS